VTEFETAKQFDNFTVEWCHSDFCHGFFTGVVDDFLNFLGDFGNDFLDSGRMNTSVKNEAFHGFSGDFAAHGIKTGENDSARSVINENSDSSGGFKSTNVTTFAANDAAFHLLIGDGDGGGGRFENLIACVALDGGNDDGSGFFLRLGFCLFHDVLGELSGIVNALFFDLLNVGGADFVFVELGNFCQLLSLLI